MRIPNLMIGLGVMVIIGGMIYYYLPSYQSYIPSLAVQDASFICKPQWTYPETKISLVPGEWCGPIEVPDRFSRRNGYQINSGIYNIKIKLDDGTVLDDGPNQRNQLKKYQKTFWLYSDEPATVSILLRG